MRKGFVGTLADRLWTVGEQSATLPMGRPLGFSAVRLCHEMVLKKFNFSFCWRKVFSGGSFVSVSPPVINQLFLSVSSASRRKACLPHRGGRRGPRVLLVPGAVPCIFTWLLASWDLLPQTLLALASSSPGHLCSSVISFGGQPPPCFSSISWIL